MTASLNPYITKFDADFDVEKSANYRLTIQLALGGLSFALFDTDNKLVGIESYQSDLLGNSNDLLRTLEKALEAKELNNKPFQSVNCLIDERFNTIVPKALYSPDNNENTSASVSTSQKTGSSAATHWRDMKPSTFSPYPTHYRPN